MKAKAKLFISTAITAAFSIAAPAAGPTSCDVRLSLQLTPDAASTQSPGFLTALVADPRYQLTWIQGSDTSAIVQLTGPGSDSQCSEGIDRLGRSSHVQDVKVIQPGSTETEGS